MALLKLMRNKRTTMPKESQEGEILLVCTRQLCPPEGHEECWLQGKEDGASIDWPYR